jgi:DMSO/TMAO reductase YedYZ molybdopterin-dependent catalytic subunit
MTTVTRQRDTEPAAIAAFRGIAAVVAGLGTAELIAGILPSHPSPIAAISGFLVDISPTWVKEFAIVAFGTADKVVLVVVVAIAALALAAGVGLLERRRRGAGIPLVVLLGLVGAVAPTSRGEGVLGLVPGILGTVVTILALRYLPHGRARRVEPADPETADAADPGPSRRAVLAWAGGLTVAGALAAVSGAAMSGLLRAGSAVSTALGLPTPKQKLPPVPAAADFGIEELAPVITPVADFYRVDTAFLVPEIAPQDWRLRVHGLVDSPFELGWDELAELDFEEFDVTLLCVSNPVGGPYIGNARWLGTRLQPLIERAGPQADADMVLSMSADGWTASTPLEALADPERAAMLAVGMNGEPLTTEHGAPVRMVVPGLYGYVSATKWVVDLEVTRFDAKTAYWTDRGWGERGPVKLQSRIDVPSDGGYLDAGPTVIAGVAWFPHTGIEGVEVRIDDEDWRPAELAASLGIDSWVQWRLDWDATPGKHWVSVRAIGQNAEEQTSAIMGVLPDGATGYHVVGVQVG